MTTPCAAMKMFSIVPTLLALGCDDPFKSTQPPPSPIELHAFPDQVSPGGETAVVLTIHDDCAATRSCAVCIGTPSRPDGGVLFATGAAQHSELALDGLSATTSFVYIASSFEGSDVIEASLVNGVASCTGDASVTHTLGSATVRIVVTNGAAMVDAGSRPIDASSSDARDASGDAVSDAPSDTGGE